jgi:hypothetical protein
MSDDWKYVIWSDESSFTLLPVSGRIDVGKTLKEPHDPECLVPTAKHGGGCIMIWAAISWYSAGLRITLNGRITASNYADTLRNQVHPMFQILFLRMMYVFKMKIRPYAQPEVFSLCLRIMKMHFNATGRLKYHRTTVVSFR